MGKVKQELLKELVKKAVNMDFDGTNGSCLQFVIRSKEGEKYYSESMSFWNWWEVEEWLIDVKDEFSSDVKALIEEKLCK